MFLNQGLFLWSAVPWHRFVLGPEGLLSVAVDRGLYLSCGIFIVETPNLGVLLPDTRDRDRGRDRDRWPCTHENSWSEREFFVFVVVRKWVLGI